MLRGFLLASLALLAGVSGVHAADAEHGRQVFQACAACHGDGSGGDLGPSLVGVIGRKAGSREDFRYSAAMTRAGFAWDEATLIAFVRDPRSVVAGTRMPFGGLDNEADAQDVVAFVASLK